MSADGVDIMIAPPSAPLSYSPPFPLPVARSGYEVTRVLATNALRLFPHHAVSGHPTLATTEVFITGLRLVQHLVSACSCALSPGSFVSTTTLMTKGLDGVCSGRHLHPARRCVYVRDAVYASSVTTMTVLIPLHCVILTVPVLVTACGHKCPSVPPWLSTVRTCVS